MPRPQYFDIDPANVDPDGIAENQTTAGAADLVLNGALCDLGTPLRFDIGDSYSSGIAGVQIAIDSAGDISAVNFTVYGKNQDGVDTTEVITNVTTTAVESATYWSQITRIAADAEVTSNVFVGPVDEVITKTYPLNWRCEDGAAAAVTGVTGTINYDIDESFSDPQAGTTAMVWFTSQDNKSADLAAVLSVHARAVRLKVNSYTDTAELQFAVVQN
jgi:hypothetical protein